MKLRKILSVIGLLSTIDSAYAGCTASDCKSTKNSLSKVFTECFTVTDIKKGDFQTLVKKTNPNCATEFLKRCDSEKDKSDGCAKVKKCKESSTCIIEEPPIKSSKTENPYGECIDQDKHPSVCSDYKHCIENNGIKKACKEKYGIR